MKLSWLGEARPELPHIHFGGEQSFNGFSTGRLRRRNWSIDGSGDNREQRKWKRRAIMERSEETTLSGEAYGVWGRGWDLDCSQSHPSSLALGRTLPSLSTGQRPLHVTACKPSFPVLEKVHSMGGMGGMGVSTPATRFTINAANCEPTSWTVRQVIARRWLSFFRSATFVLELKWPGLLRRGHQRWAEASLHCFLCQRLVPA